MYESKCLRLSVLDDAQMKEIYPWFNDYAIQANTLNSGSKVRPWTFDEFKKDLEDNQNRYAVYAKGGKDVLQCQEPDRLIGVGVISLYELTHLCTLFTYLKADERGKGYGTELSQLLTDLSFLECNAHKVHTCIYSWNVASYKRYEKLGFHLEGVLRDEVFRGGQYWDVCYYGLLREEWDKWKCHATTYPETFLQLRDVTPPTLQPERSRDDSDALANWEKG
jgi:RimJ/RimL family protein N-acetyltransferase